MPTRLKAFLLLLLLPTFCFTPAFAQTTPTPPRLIYTPGSTPPPAGTLVYTPSVAPAQATNAQVAALTAQNSALQALVAAAAATYYGQAFTNRFSGVSPPYAVSSTGPHLVFAHILMSAGDYGKHYYGQCPSVADYVLDIQEAKACGIDGFAANIGAWTVPYQEAWYNLLTAADQVNAASGTSVNSAGVGKFYIFAQPDMSGFPADTPTLLALLNAGVSHPSYYRYNGRAWFGTYAGEGGTYAQVKARFQPVIAAMAAEGQPVYFCPFFNIRDASGNVPATAQATSNATEISGLLGNGFAQAAWLFGTGTGPALGASSALPQAEMYSASLRSAGIQWMGTVTPQYTGMAHSDYLPGSSHFYIEAYGGETLDHQWTSLIQSQGAYWVQLVTWNDDDEGSNFTNADFGPTSPWPYLAHSSIADYYKSKAGLQALNLYYIQWYKTGVRPTIVKDAVFAFYRTQPAAMTSSDPLGPVSPLTTEDGSAVVTDTFYVCTMATKTSTLSVSNGSFTKSVTVPPGLFFSRLTGFVPGPVSFALSQNYVPVVTLSGEPIVSSATAYNWNYYTAWAHD